MKAMLTILFMLALNGCAAATELCLGSADLPESVASKFESSVDQQLLDMALGLPEQGGLCQARVYKSKAKSEITLYRAWNSTNANSQFGKWWAFEKPAGKVSTYRSEFEICYQWSPLDMLVECKLRSEVSVVVGTGQSAKCSEYLSYPVSDKLQIYINNAAAELYNCRLLEGEFSWK